ncbi:MAG: potassium transporter, partial [Lentisphaeria bacterium]|nr:potassium transporter [Lentisphaeria bacterium]
MYVKIPEGANMVLSSIKKSQFYFILSFAVLVVFGTLLLKLPIMYNEDCFGKLSWIDAFFTSTSAVCVNGLAILPLSNFSYLGQVFIMLLIQLGGIGIMTMSASIIFFLGKSVGWSTNKLISNITESNSQNSMENMLKEITIYTIIVEMIGMFILLAGFLSDGYNIYDSLWFALFYSISAFCNAGFSPLDN